MPFQKSRHGRHKCPKDEFSNKDDTDDDMDDYDDNDDYSNNDSYDQNDNPNSNSDANDENDNDENYNDKSNRHRDYSDGSDNDTDDDDDFSDDRFDDSKGSSAVKDVEQIYGTERSRKSSINTVRCEVNYTPEKIRKIQGLQDNYLNSQLVNSYRDSTAAWGTLLAPEDILRNSEISTDLGSHYKYVPLEAYLLDVQQHELLVLGIGRRPLNVIIGDGDLQSATTINAFTDLKHRTTDSSQHVSTPLENDTMGPSSHCLHSSGAAESFVRSSSSASMVEPCLDNLSHQMLIFLLNQEDPFTLPKTSVGKSSLVGRIYFDVQHQSLATGRRAALTASRSTTTRSLETVTVISCTVDSAPKSVALTNSLTSVASHPAPLPQWHTSDLDQMLTTEDYDCAFDFPCDYIECKELFLAAELEHWIEHSISNCPFCDDAVFNDEFDLESNWRNRMYHIFDHLQYFVAPENQRPDYFLLDHMWQKGLLNNESYRYLTRFTERPYCPNLVPFDYEPPERISKREINSMLPVDLANNTDSQRNRS